MSTKKILVPVIMDQVGVNALNYAKQLMNGEDASYSILCLRNPFFNFLNSSPVLTDLEFAEKVESYFLNNSNVESKELRVIIDSDEIVSGILKFANSGKYDRVVIGRKKKHNVIRKMLGTISLGVVKQASIPVYVVPENFEFKPLRTVLVSIGEKLSEKQSDFMIKWNKKYNAFLKIIHFITDDNEDLSFNKDEDNLINSLFYQDELTFEYEIMNKKVDSVSDQLKSIDKEEVQMIMLFSGHQFLIESWMYGSNTKDLMNRCSLPVLYAPEKMFQ